jgi:hypothetical protein
MVAATLNLCTERVEPKVQSIATGPTSIIVAHYGPSTIILPGFGPDAVAAARALAAGLLAEADRLDATLVTPAREVA